ncbi:MAG: penicillin acylase family protein [Candidatus Hydrogenedentes bacterium]|nr:penicillin acylase family protein [Candidatus Hydrogenedentota bacterium]
MKWLRRIAEFTLIVLVAAAVTLTAALVYLARTRLPNLDGTVASGQLHGEVSIIRDAAGVPHITAETETDAYFALGYCMAQDRLFQMELMRRLARGELAEVLGPPLVKVDRAVRAFRLRAKAEEYFAHPENTPPEVLAVIEAYVAGVNAFIADGPLPFELTVLQAGVRPFTAVDCLSVAAILPITFADGIRGDPLVTMLKERHPDMDIDALFPGYSLDVPVTIMESLEEAKAYLEHGESQEPQAEDRVQRLLARDHAVREWVGMFTAIAQRFGPAMGSNSFVLGPSRTASGMPILGNDPHIAFTNPGIWYEAHLQYGDFENYGFHLPPIPVPLLGHNRQRGWALTMSTIDDVDFYVERFDPDDPGRVMYKGEWTPVETVVETIRVRFADDVTCNVRVTPHGPIINDFLSAYHGYDGDPVSLSWVWQHVDYTDITAFYRMGHARTSEEFEQAVALITSPGMNISYADADGTIAWWAAGKIPIRPPHVNSKQMLDGASGEDEMLGYLPFDQNPRLMNPDCGYIVTANNKPTVKPIGSVEDVIGYWQPEDRAGRLEELLSQRSDWTVEQLKAVQLDDTGYAAQDVLEELLAVLEPETESFHAREQDALRRLQSWDLRHDVDSVGATLYEHLCGAVLRRALEDETGADNFHTYSTLADHWNFFKHFVGDSASPFWDDVSTGPRESRDEIIAAAFRGEVASLAKRFGGNVDTWTWGRAHTMTFEHPFGRLPLLGGIFDIGPFPSAGGAQVVNNMLYHFGQDSYDVIAGPSTRRLIDFAAPDQSLTILPTGNSGNFMSPNYADQAGRFMAGEYRQALLNGVDIQAQKVHELRFVPTSNAVALR